MTEFRHVSILLDACIQNLRCSKGGVYIDGTLGGGGHTYHILASSSPTGIVFGIDRDEEAIAAASKRCATFGERLIPIHGNFMEMSKLIPAEYAGKVDGILLDLGVSSYQLDNAARGFSYMQDGRLDMRMDASQSLSAYEVVNTYSQNDLTRIFYEYGEEHWSKRIAQFIIEKRARSPIETTGELVQIIKAAIPAAARKGGPHPATRVFQAIRIEVNGELSPLRDALNSMIDLLKDGGRLCVITFHSLEDRIVKQVMKTAEHPCTCPPKAPMCVCGKLPRGKVMTRKPILPSEEEMAENPRARSAKLRVFAKCSKEREERIP